MPKALLRILKSPTRQFDWRIVPEVALDKLFGRRQAAERAGGTPEGSSTANDTPYNRIEIIQPDSGSGEPI